MSRRSTVVLAAVVVLVLAAAAAAVVALRGRATDVVPAAAATSTAAAPVAGIAAMKDGQVYVVGVNLEPGVYRQAVQTPACQWQVTDLTGQEIERGVPGQGPVTVNLGQDTKFTSTGCGAWMKG